MIEIKFSRVFDRGTWAGAKQSGSSSIGHITVGELGLLDLLETQLGIKKPESLNYQRKIDYLKALRSANEESRFYSESFVTDPMAVTEHLLAIRDQLIIANWQKCNIEDLKKVNDLCEVEKHFANTSGTADRLLALRETLRARKVLTSIKSFISMDAKEELPALWKDVISHELPRLGIAVQFAPNQNKSCSVLKSDLSRLLTLNEQEAHPIGDDSLMILTGRDPWESARFVAVYLGTIPSDQLQKTVIVAHERHRGILLSAMLAQGIPFGGSHSEISYARPALQIVILALALSWEPKDPSCALSLLTIEGSPVFPAFRRALMRSLNESLAVGGQTWTDSLEEVTKILIDLAETNEEREKIQKRKKRIESWFSAPSFLYDDGIPVTELVSTCKRVSDWLRQVWVMSKKSSFREASESSEFLGNLAKGLGEEKITRERMIHLLNDSVGKGIIADSVLAQANGPRVVSNPGNILAPAERIIWWDFSAATILDHKEKFFSMTETRRLRDNRIRWPDPEAQSQLNALKWKTPFLMAQTSLMLVNQQLDADGNPETLHPVLGELLPKAARQTWMERLHINLLEKESDASKHFLKLLGAKKEKCSQDPFEQRSHWTVKKNTLGPRAVESASSLEQLLGCELAYVLRYKADLDGGPSALQYDVRMMGIIAHEIISLVFKKGERPKVAAALEGAKGLLDGIIKDKAPQLFQKSRARELADLKQIIRQDIQIYAEFLEDNQLSIESSELEVRKSEETIAGVHLVGKIDHILADEKNNRIVIDHKWGSAKYKEQDLVEGKSLQLALYSKFVKETQPPSLAYHMITDGKILLLNSHLKRAQQVNGPESPVVLHEAEIHLKTKLALLQSGQLQAHGLDDKNKEHRFEAPCEYCNFTIICGLKWKK